MNNPERKEDHSVPVDDGLTRPPIRQSELDRFKFGRRWYYKIAKDNDGTEPFCLDIGSGHRPFPKAHVLCDLHVERVPDRSMRELVTEGKPFVMCSCSFLPFKERAFDFVTCYYVFEHIDSPGRVFQEIRRVSNHGYVQCPSWLNEIMYGEKVHKWIVIKKHERLYARPIQDGKRFKLRLGFVFHRLYCSKTWRLVHAILDETLHLFTIRYTF